MSKQRITLYIDARLWRDFRAACIKRGFSASQIVDLFMHEQLEAWSLSVEDEKPRRAAEWQRVQPSATGRKADDDQSESEGK